MSTKSNTGTGLLLAVALLAQSLRLYFPFIPKSGEYVPHRLHYICYICFRHMALWLEEWSCYCLDCFPVVAKGYLQGMLPLPPFILITALGTTAYVRSTFDLKNRRYCLLSWRPW